MIYVTNNKKLHLQIAIVSALVFLVAALMYTHIDFDFGLSHPITTILYFFAVPMIIGSILLARRSFELCVLFLLSWSVQFLIAANPDLLTIQPFVFITGFFYFMPIYLFEFLINPLYTILVFTYALLVYKQRHNILHLSWKHRGMHMFKSVLLVSISAFLQILIVLTLSTLLVITLFLFR